MIHAHRTHHKKRINGSKNEKWKKALVKVKKKKKSQVLIDSISPKITNLGVVKYTYIIISKFKF